MTREEHAAKINEIIKGNRTIKAKLDSQNNKPSQLRNYVSADVEEAYNRGYDEGKGQAWSDEIKKYEIEPEKEREAYQRGLDDAWECARKIADGALWNEYLKMHGSACAIDVLNAYSAQEAIAKIAEYEKQKDVIKIGDEVKFNHDNSKATVMDQSDKEDMWWLYTENGCIEEWQDAYFRKTGRTFPQIAEVLKAMQEGMES